MALQSSGAISLSDIQTEFGGENPISLSEYYRDGDYTTSNNTSVPTSGAISLSNFYDASGEITVTSEALINGLSNRKQMLASDFVSAGGILVIPANFWVWSDAVGAAALTIDVSCTIKNSGKIIGKGGRGGNNTSSSNNGESGGPAIKINSGVTGVTIFNYSGAHIAAGGGGSNRGSSSGGGGGAGGGQGGYSVTHRGIQIAAGGSINAYGATNPNDFVGNPDFDGYPATGRGGGAGGGGGAIFNSGGGGGRRLDSPSSTIGSTGEGTTGAFGGRGGRNGATGTVGTYAGYGGHSNTAGQSATYGAGGGGGWGASGGDNPYYSSDYPGSGGKAIDDSGQTYSLSNSGTVWGGT